MNLTDVIKHIDMVLRYVGAGGVALLTFGYLSKDRFAFVCVGDDTTDFSSLLVAVYIAVAGTSVYTIHRAIAHPFINRAILKYLGQKQDLFDLERELSRHRIKRRNSDDKDEKGFQEKLDRWAAEAHFLYCGSWAIILAGSAAHMLCASWDRRTIIALLAVLLFLLSAVMHDGRATREEIHKLPNGDAT